MILMIIDCKLLVYDTVCCNITVTITSEEKMICYEIDNDSKSKTYEVTRLSFPCPPATHLFTLSGQLILLVVYLSPRDPVCIKAL